jgi:hypothetical protein
VALGHGSRCAANGQAASATGRNRWRSACSSLTAKGIGKRGETRTRDVNKESTSG